ncbi:MAG: hypothetical protein ABGY42_08500 [bacterium]
MQITRILSALALATGLALPAHPALAAQSDSEAFVAGSTEIGGALQGDVAFGGTSIFVGTGSFGAGAQSILRIAADGTSTTVVTGLNSIGGIIFDAATGSLFFTDNGGDIVGAATGDTVFKLTNALTATGATAAGLEILASGTIPAAAQLVLADTNTLLVTSAAGGGTGGVIQVDLAGATSSQLFAGLDYAGGISVRSDGSLLVGNVDSSFIGSIEEYSSTGVHQSTFAAPVGAFDQALDADGNLLVTGSFASDWSSSVVVSLSSNASPTQIGSGWEFSAGIDIDAASGRIGVLDSCFPTACTAVTTLTPVAKMTGLGRGRKDCNVAFFGGVESRNRHGKGRGRWECTDGDTSCDRDGTADGTCTFLVGACTHLVDPLVDTCSAAEVTSFEVKRSPTIADGGAFPAFQTLLNAIAGQTEAMCSESLAIEVPRNKKVVLKLKAKSGRKTLDRDRLRLFCR